MMSGTHFTYIAAISFNDALNPVSKAAAGLNGLSVHEGAVFLYGSDERFLGGMRALVTLSLQNAPEKTVWFKSGLQGGH